MVIMITEITIRGSIIIIMMMLIIITIIKIKDSNDGHKL